MGTSRSYAQRNPKARTLWPVSRKDDFCAMMRARERASIHLPLSTKAASSIVRCRPETIGRVNTHCTRAKKGESVKPRYELRTWNYDQSPPRTGEAPPSAFFGSPQRREQSQAIAWRRQTK